MEEQSLRIRAWSGGEIKSHGIAVCSSGEEIIIVRLVILDEPKREVIIGDTC